MAERTLYHYGLCPFSRAIRVLLGEKKLDSAEIIQKTWQRDTAFLALNPAGTVPVLVENTGATICGVFAIREYLDEAYPNHPMYPTDLVQRAEVRRLVDWFDQKFYQDVTDAIVGEKLFAPLVRGESPESRYIRAGKSNFKIHATYMEWLLGQHECLAGDDWTAADFVAAAHLSLIDYTGDVPWAAYPVLKEWYMRIKSRPSFRPLLMDYFSPIKPAADYRNLDF